MKRVFVICTILSFILTGCAVIDEINVPNFLELFSKYFDSEEDKFAIELAEEGMDLYKRGKYSRSLETFEKLKDHYPFSKFSMLAELKIGDCHYKLEEYEEAIFAYEEFENLHPRNEATPYVAYQIGRCYFDRIDTPDRDQNSAREAVTAFFRVKQQYPDSAYANKADEHIKESLKSMAAHDFTVGMFYYKSKHYKAALGRFKSVLTNYPDVGIHKEVLQYIALCEAALTKQEY